jgi:MYXO-CTERM domain-containing protein
MSVYEASTYIYGHTHDYSAKYRDGTLHVNLDTLGKGDERNVGIGVIDQDLLSMRVFSAGIWPYVVISAPADAGLGGGNPHAYSVPPDWTEAPVRAVVFAPTAPEAVEFRVGDRAWTPMTAVRDKVWQGTMDTTGMEPGRYNLTVRAHPWTKATDTISFRIGATACSNGLDDDFDGLTDWPDDPGCESPGTNDEEWILPTVDPDPEPIPEVAEPMPDTPFAEDASPDAFAEEVGPDAFAEDTDPDDAVEPPPDDGTTTPDLPTPVDPGATEDAWVAPDTSGRSDNAAWNDVAPGTDAFVGDSASFDAGRSTGGCTTGGTPASGTWIWLLVPIALLLAARRRGRPGSAR